MCFRPFPGTGGCEELFVAPGTSREIPARDTPVQIPWIAHQQAGLQHRSHGGSFWILTLERQRTECCLGLVAGLVPGADTRPLRREGPPPIHITPTNAGHVMALSGKQMHSMHVQAHRFTPVFINLPIPKPSRRPWTCVPCARKRVLSEADLYVGIPGTPQVPATPWHHVLPTPAKAALAGLGALVALRIVARAVRQRWVGGWQPGVARAAEVGRRSS